MVATTLLASFVALGATALWPQVNALPPSNQSLDVLLPVDTRNVDYSAPACTITLMENYTFGYSYNTPYQGPYAAPPCANDVDYSLAFLRFQANVDPGRQFDRLVAVWVDSLELLRSTTQEPNRLTSPHWEVFKDISHYRKIFAKGGNVTVSLDNIVNTNYTSSFHVTVKVEFYKEINKACGHLKTARRVPALPDVIVPISNKASAYSWFNVQPNTLGQNFNAVTLPQNLESLHLELFISHHGCDEFHYINPPDAYKAAVGTMCGGGAFREIQIFIDGALVSAVWPFPLIYTGGLSPALWRPIVATGAFEAPTYLVDLTPFLALVVDGKSHNISFGIDYGLDYWPTTGNLLAYLDKNGNVTQTTIDSKVLDAHVVPTVTTTGVAPNFTVTTTASRQILVSSTIKTSKGTREYGIKQTFGYKNTQVYSHNADDVTFDQRTTIETTTFVKFEGDPAPTTTWFREDYPLRGILTYRTYVYDQARTETIGTEHNKLDNGSFRLPRINRIKVDNAQTETTGATAAIYFLLNVTIDHGFYQSLEYAGSSRHYATGISPYQIAIAQKATAQINSRIEANATTSVSLQSSNNLTGCYSRDVASVTLNYTTYEEGQKCPSHKFG
ncbi:hypothetical protein AeMF1_002154 [Aphanomyces euteiches]|nr:hypothetical protein AeMF1_002154 [Aphanomyces euteiches]KAH9188022.1 hypothetical protein AeNC1_009999 [Aphanomyces euteiches]